MLKGYVYCVRMVIPDYTHPIKIGYTVKPELRRSNYACGPYPIVWVGAWPAKSGSADERAIHAKFSKFRMTGEWFSPEPSLLEFVQSHIEQCQDLTTRFGEEEAYNQFEALIHVPPTIYLRPVSEVSDEEKEQIRREYLLLGKPPTTYFAEKYNLMRHTAWIIIRGGTSQRSIRPNSTHRSL